MISEMPVQLDQIEIWQRALEKRRNLITEAADLQAQLLRHRTETTEKFRHVRSIYATAHICLSAPAAIDANSYRALRALRNESSELRKAWFKSTSFRFTEE